MNDSKWLKCPALEAHYIEAFNFRKIDDADELTRELKLLPNWIRIHDDIIRMITNPNPDSYKEPKVYCTLSSLIAKPHFPGQYHKLMGAYLCIGNQENSVNSEALQNLMNEKRKLVCAIFDILDDSRNRKYWRSISDES